MLTIGCISTSTKIDRHNVTLCENNEFNVSICRAQCMCCPNSPSPSPIRYAVGLLRSTCNALLPAFSLLELMRTHALFHSSSPRWIGLCWRWSLPLLGRRLSLSQELCVVLPLVSKHCLGWLQVRVLQLQHHRQFSLPAHVDRTSCADRAGYLSGQGHLASCTEAAPMQKHCHDSLYRLQQQPGAVL